MCIDLFHVYVLRRVVDKGGRDDGIKKGGGDTQGTIGRKDSESMDVEIMGLLKS